MVPTRHRTDDGFELHHDATLVMPDTDAWRRHRETDALGDERRFTASLVIPTLNEAAGIARLLAEIPAYLDEVIVVDGGSIDGTLDVVASLCPDAVVFRQSGKGKGNAIKEGLAVATGEIVVTMDADGSMAMTDVDRMVEALLEGCDFVKGSRSMPGGGSDDFTTLRRAGNWGLTLVANALFGAAYTDITYGFNAYWRQVVVDISSLSDGFQFEIQMAIRAARAGLRTREVACHEHARVGGVSKLHPMSDGWEILKVILGETLPRRRVKLRAMADLHLSPTGI